MLKKNPDIAKIKEIIKAKMPKILSGKILEFNKEFLSINTASAQQEKEQAKERELFQALTTAKPAAEEKSAVPANEEDKTKAAAAAKDKDPAKAEASAWNAKAYHWEEKAVAGWAAERFKQLLSAVSLEVAGGKLRIAEIKNFVGDVQNVLEPCRPRSTSGRERR